jgi:hypothetical protein
VHGHLIAEEAGVGRGDDSLADGQQAQRGEHEVGDVLKVVPVPCCRGLGGKKERAIDVSSLGEANASPQRTMPELPTVHSTREKAMAQYLPIRSEMSPPEQEWPLSARSEQRSGAGCFA